MRRLLSFAFTALCCISPLQAQSHPLGNFTINHLTETTFTKNDVTVRYVLDMAEIPSYQTMREITSGKLTSSQLDAWATREGARDVRQLRLSVNGRPVTLRFTGAHAALRPGAGGLSTLYMTAFASAPIGLAAGGQRTFMFSDATYPGRLGWRDAIVSPQKEPTALLTAYPNAALGSARAVTQLQGTVAANGIATVSRRSDESGSRVEQALPQVPVTANESLERSNQLSDMIAHGTGDWGFVAITLLVAIMLGALHALEPGHGKTLLAISLVGARATVKQATILATALTIAHTIGVLALGLALNLFKGYFVPEQIYPWITLVSGIVIAVIGARAISRELQRRQPVAAHAHTHHHDHAHPHDHTHSHDHDAHDHHRHENMSDAEHARSHAIPGTAPLRFGPTVWAAMSGGVAPCPAALVVLLAAIALDQVTYGIFVIVAFSFGLAGTLTTLGIAVVRGASWLQQRPQFDRYVQHGPLLSAGVISLIGSIMVGQGFIERGVAAPAYVISLIVLLVIAAYAFSHPFGHRHLEVQ